jgi:hypothetical protein
VPANKKISQLAEQTSLSGVESQCFVVIVNENGENKRVAVSNLPAGGGSGSVSALNDLSDVQLSGVQQGDILVYEVTAGTPKFQNTQRLNGGFF